MAKIILIAIANNGEPIYDFFKQIKEIQNEMYDEIEIYFMYADPFLKEGFKVDGNDVFVKVEENVTKGCTIKTLKTLEWIDKEKDYDYVVRTNLSSVFNINNLVKGVNTLTKTEPICSGLVFGNVSFGTFIVWNRLTVKRLIQPESYKMLDTMRYAYNDDILLSKLCEIYKIKFDSSLTHKVVETQYSFFHSPPIGDDWILVKRPRNEFTTRYFSDMWSINQENVLPKEIRSRLVMPCYDPSDFAYSILRALRFMDMSWKTEYMKQNISILIDHIQHLRQGHCELIYYCLKYYSNWDLVVKKIILSSYYEPDIKFIDVIFYYGIVERRLSKDIYDMLGMKTGTWRDL